MSLIKRESAVGAPESAPCSGRVHYQHSLPALIKPLKADPLGYATNAGSVYGRILLIRDRTSRALSKRQERQTLGQPSYKV